MRRPAHHYRHVIDGTVCNVYAELARGKDGHVSLRVSCVPTTPNPRTPEHLHELLIDQAPWGGQS